ncbi:MAG: hypothetical protein V7749_08470 [Cocleimonas sp.]
MSEILELQSGQVSFISSLMAGFSLSIAVQLIRLKQDNYLSLINFLFFTLTALSFLIALYIDVALLLRTVGMKDFSPELILEISHIRNVGTSAATFAFFLFILSIGMVGWLHSRLAGIVTTLVSLITLFVLGYSRHLIINLS